MWLKCKLTPVHYRPEELEKGMMFIRNVFFGNFSYNELYVLGRMPSVSVERYVEEHGFPVQLSIVYEGNGNDELPVTLISHEQIGWWDEGEDSDEYYDVTLKELNIILQDYEGELNLLMEEQEESFVPEIFEGKCIISFTENEFIIDDETYNENEENFEKFINQEENEQW